MESTNIGEIAGTIAAVFTALGLLGRYLLSPLLKLTKRLKRNFQEMSKALPVLLDISRRWPLLPSGGSLNDEIHSLHRDFAHAKIWIRALLDLLNTIAYEADSKGHCTWVSERWREVSGLSLEDCLGEGWVNGIAEKDRKRVFEEWRLALAEERLFNIRFSMVNREDVETRVHSKGIAIRLNDGEVIGCIGINVEE